MPNVRERMRKRLDRTPIWRKIEDKYDGPASDLRNRISFGERFPKFENRNFGGGVGAGVVAAGIITIIEDTVGVPFGADAEIIGVEPQSDGILYTVNVNAPTQDIAEARAFIDAGTGFTTILTDLLDVRSVELTKTRMLRDTYQVQVMVED